MKKVLVLILLSSLVLAFNAGYKMEKPVSRNILVFPFNRFELHSEIELAKLNEINGLTDDQFYPELLAAVNEAFETNDHQRLYYKVVTALDMERLRLLLKYDKKGANAHYACNLDEFDETQYRELLSGYDCDFLLTLNWYRIMKDKASYKKNKIKKIAWYSYHYVDFDLFDTNQHAVRHGTQLKIQVPPSEKNIGDMGVKVDDLRPELRKLVNEINAIILNG